MLSGYPAPDVAATILVAVKDFTANFDVKQVTVCSILHRQVALVASNVSQFNETAHKTAALLKGYVCYASQQPFGSYSVLFKGDLNQLKPGCDKYIFTNPTSGYTGLKHVERPCHNV